MSIRLVSGIKHILKGVLESFQEYIDGRMDKFEGMQADACYDCRLTDQGDQAY